MNSETIKTIENALFCVKDELSNTNEFYTEWQKMRLCQIQLEKILKDCVSKKERMTKKLVTQWKKIEVKVRNSAMSVSELEYQLPSGFVDREIKVFEDAFGNLNVKHVYRK